VELKPGYKQTEVGAIPEEWETPTLDSVAKRGSGHTPNKKHPEYWDGDIKWVSLKDSDALDRVYIDETAATITRAGIANSSAVVHPAGTVVLSRDAGVGKSAIMKSAMAVSQHFMAWQCGPCLDNHFLYYWLQSEKSEFERIAIGNTIKTIGLSYFRALNIPLPPLPEQRAIAGVLSDVDELIGALDQLIGKKRDLKQATMQQLLTGQKRLPGFHGEWEPRTLRSIVQTPITDGPHMTPKFLDDGIPFLSVNNLVDNRIDLSELRFISREDDREFSKKCKPRRGDVLLGKAASVGKVAIVDTDFDFNIWSPIALIRVGFGHNSRFVYYQLQAPNLAKQIVLLTNASSQGNIGMGDIEKLTLQLPAPEEQAAIAEVLTDMDAELAALEQRRDKTRALKQGMMQELLTGKTRLVDSGKLKVESNA